jgi:tRNA pseudouridine65 synthase
MKLPTGPGVRLLNSHPCGLVALDKPAGTKSHPNDSRPDPKAVLSWSYDAHKEMYLNPSAEGGYFLLNRLDSPTSGVLLLCDSEPVADAARQAFAGKSVEKTYHALVLGRPVRPREVWRDRLQISQQKGQLRVRTGTGIPAETDMRLQWSSRTQPLVSLLQLRPLTGRTHQLRVQCAHRHLPIVGDATYGDFTLNRQLKAKRLFLHSSSVSLILQLPSGLIKFTAESPLPEPFTRYR